MIEVNQVVSLSENDFVIKIKAGPYSFNLTPEGVRKLKNNINVVLGNIPDGWAMNFYTEIDGMSCYLTNTGLQLRGVYFDNEIVELLEKLNAV